MIAKIFLRSPHIIYICAHVTQFFDSNVHHDLIIKLNG